MRHGQHTATAGLWHPLLLATDVSAGMIANAREKLAAQSTRQLSFAVADGDELSADICDAVPAFNVLNLSCNLDRTLAVVTLALNQAAFLSQRLHA